MHKQLPDVPDGKAQFAASMTRDGARWTMSASPDGNLTSETCWPLWPYNDVPVAAHHSRYDSAPESVDQLLKIEYDVHALARAPMRKASIRAKRRSDFIACMNYYRIGGQVYYINDVTVRTQHNDQQWERVVNVDRLQKQATDPDAQVPDSDDSDDDEPLPADADALRVLSGPVADDRQLRSLATATHVSEIDNTDGVLSALSQSTGSSVLVDEIDSVDGTSTNSLHPVQSTMDSASTDAALPSSSIQLHTVQPTTDSASVSDAALPPPPTALPPADTLINCGPIPLLPAVMRHSVHSDHPASQSSSLPDAQAATSDASIDNAPPQPLASEQQCTPAVIEPPAEQPREVALLPSIMRAGRPALRILDGLHPLPPTVLAPPALRFIAPGSAVRPPTPAPARPPRTPNPRLPRLTSSLRTRAQDRLAAQSHEHEPD
jgi:hypothetical protein